MKTNAGRVGFSPVEADAISSWFLVASSFLDEDAFFSLDIEKCCLHYYISSSVKNVNLDRPQSVLGRTSAYN